MKNLREKEFNIYKTYIKRFLGFILSLIAIILLSPLLLIMAILVKLDGTGGPVIFSQERLGKDLKVFYIYKFRTMVPNAINKGSGLRTLENDSRITSVGRVLRKTSLDELPQIFNILKGDMSFIGPRPPVPYFPKYIEEYDSKEKTRFSIRPGITGLAQVKIRNAGTWEDRFFYDYLYIDNLSFFYDIKLFFRTIAVVLKRENIYG